MAVTKLQKHSLFFSFWRYKILLAQDRILSVTTSMPNMLGGIRGFYGIFSIVYNTVARLKKKLFYSDCVYK